MAQGFRSSSRLQPRLTCRLRHMSGSLLTADQHCRAPSRREFPGPAEEGPAEEGPTAEGPSPAAMDRTWNLTAPEEPKDDERAQHKADGNGKRPRTVCGAFS